MHPDFKRATLRVAVTGAALEGLVVLGALLWTLRPDGDIGACDVCTGDRSVEALFGGGAAALLVALGSVFVLLNMLVGRVGWSALQRRRARRMPAGLPWVSGLVPITVLVVIVAGGKLIDAARTRNQRARYEGYGALMRALSGANQAGGGYVPVAPLIPMIETFGSPGYMYRVVRPGEEPGPGTVGLVEQEMTSDLFVAVYTERDGEHCRLVAARSGPTTVLCDGRAVTPPGCSLPAGSGSTRTWCLQPGSRSSLISGAARRSEPPQRSPETEIRWEV